MNKGGTTRLQQVHKGVLELFVKNFIFSAMYFIKSLTDHPAIIIIG